MRAISELAFGEEPVVGRPYLVPCVDLSIYSTQDWDYCGFRLAFRLRMLTRIPVIGHSHKDPEFPGAGGEKQHIHLDVRFMNEMELEVWDITKRTLTNDNFNGFPTIPIVPSFADERSLTPTLKSRYCKRLMPNYREAAFTGEYYQAFEDRFESSKIKLDKPICPHQGTPLGGISAVDGIVSCPTHGLGFCAKSGAMVRKTKRLGREPIEQYLANCDIREKHICGIQQ
jgi:hypothetical protein